MRTAFLWLALLACKARDDESMRKPLHYVDTCTPGQSTTECWYLLNKTPAQMFPAGRLEGLRFRTELLKGTGEHFTGKLSQSDAVLTYSMLFNVGRDDVRGMLIKEMGEPLGAGPARVATASPVVGERWETDEGVWVLADRQLTWYSKPIHTDGAVPVEPSRDLDGVVQPVPKTGTLWRALGRLLTGLDTDARK